jgi:probable DNA repair protein
MDATDSRVELVPSIADALDRGAVVITANQRAARTLRYAFDRRNLQAGLTSWQPAAVFPWDGWVATLWQTLVIKGEASALLLNRAQEHKLWRSVIAADDELTASLRSPDSLAEMAADAWNMLVRHDGKNRLRAGWNNTETKAFQRWAAEFERRCRSQRLLPRAALEDSLRTALEEGRLKSTESIALVGFDEMTSAQKNFINAIASSETQVEQLRMALPIVSRALTHAEDKTREVAAAARWAKDLLRRKPDAKIAIIVPSLENQRTAIDRIFREVLAPELEDILAPNHAEPYEFSLGIPLSETPLVRVALDLARWPITSLAVERVSALLVSPLFSMEETERSARAAFDALELRRARLLRPEISIAWLVTTLRRSRRRPHLTGLINALESLIHTGTNSRQELRPHAVWADLIRERLQAARWGRAEGEDSIEFQTRQKWESTLDELATLDFDGVRVSFDQALGELERLTQQTMFAPESHHAPVQVMGPLEAAGSSFDALWFLGAGDLGWPAKSAVNPLLPWALQCDLGMPGADPALEDARSRQITQRIADSASQVVFSYATEMTEGVQRPSPLLQALHLEPVEIEQISPPASEIVPVKLEEYSDLIPLPLVPDHAIQGGAEILKLQAACGFRAFAERRLGSAELREIELGMDAAERGSVVHRVLEHFWKEVRSQAALRSMSGEERATLLAQSIEHGLRRVAIASTPGWEEAYVDLQRARLATLLGPWLELELERDPFTVKFSEEESRDVHIGPLRLNLRVDRVDVTEEGEIILDYKTGGAKSAQWQSDRPDEPQLPLYAVFTTAAEPETPLADVAFAQIRAGKDMAFESFRRRITTEKESAKRRTLLLEEQLIEWRRVLEDLAKAFHRGDASVDPKSYPTTCAHCAQRILCRLNPAAFDEDFDEEAPLDSGNG